jgi:hypothetical protein
MILETMFLFGIKINTNTIILCRESTLKINDIYENTTSGSVATVAQPMAGGAQSRTGFGKGVYSTKKVGKLTDKKSGKFVNSVRESKQIEEAHLDEEELIIVPGQGRNRKSGFIPHTEDRRDREVSMARSDLFQAAKNAKQTFEMLSGVSEDQGIEGWVQAKITKAADYLATVREYLEGRQINTIAEGAKVDRMVKHIERSEEKFGKGKKEAENIAWATANKRGMMNNKNKK